MSGVRQRQQSSSFFIGFRQFVSVFFSVYQFSSVCISFLQFVSVFFSLYQFTSVCRVFDSYLQLYEIINSFFQLSTVYYVLFSEKQATLRSEEINKKPQVTV